MNIDSSIKSRILYLAVALLAMASPAVIKAQTCKSPSAVAIRGVGTLVDGIKHLNVSLGYATDIEQGAAIEAMEAWNTQSATTHIYFEWNFSTTGRIRIGNDNSIATNSLDKCAYSDSSASPPWIKLSDSFDAAGQSSIDNDNSYLWDQLVGTIAHELGHILGMNDGGSDIMKSLNYYGNDSCETEFMRGENERGSAGVSGAASSANSCAWQGTTEGDGPGDDQRPYDSGYTCNIYLAVVHWSCSEPNECVETGYEIYGNPISSCTGGPPEM